MTRRTRPRSAPALRDLAGGEQPGPPRVVDLRRLLARAAPPGTTRSTTPASSACRGPRTIGGHGLHTVYDVILDDELAAAGAPPRPSLGYLVQGILEHGNDDIQQRFLPGIVNGRERWCQGFSEPDAGSDLASLRTRAERDGDELRHHRPQGLDLLLRRRRLVPGARPHRPRRAQAQGHLGLRRPDATSPGIEQRPLRMINGITTEFGEVLFDGARAKAADMIGEPGRGLAARHDRREPRAGARRARLRRPLPQDGEAARRPRAGRARRATAPRRGATSAWAIVEAEMLRAHVCRRLSDRLDGIDPRPRGLGRQAADDLGPSRPSATPRCPSAAPDTTATTTRGLKVYLYSRAQSVMGGTAQIQRNLIANRILELPNQ